MQKEVNQVIKLLQKTLNQNFKDFKGLYLFGYHVDGKDYPDEDIEIAAIFEKMDKEKREKIWPLVGQIESELDIFLDLHPVTIEELKNDENYYEIVVNQGLFFDIK